MNVRLRCNMILIETDGKIFMPEGSIVDLSKIPARFRKKKYVLKEGEIDPREQERNVQMAVAEGQIGDVEELLEEGSPAMDTRTRLSRR